jgi:hypothetical protein
LVYRREDLNRKEHGSWPYGSASLALHLQNDYQAANDEVKWLICTSVPTCDRPYNVLSILRSRHESAKFTGLLTIVMIGGASPRIFAFTKSPNFALKHSLSTGCSSSLSERVQPTVVRRNDLAMSHEPVLLLQDQARIRCVSCESGMPQYLTVGSKPTL